ncbi:Glucose-induced degradation protein-like protein, partial [Lachnellula subtilissima]
PRLRGRRPTPMPTPSSDESIVAVPSSHSSCPPDDDRSSWRSLEMDDTHDEAIETSPEILQQPTPPPSDSRVTGSTDTHVADPQDVKQMDIDEEIAPRDMLSPISAEGDKQEETDLPALPVTDLCSPSMGYEFSNVRLLPSSPSSYLRAGSKFRGTQQSERQVYEVQVEIKHVDMRESFLCGYLRIQGLTEDHPTLTTYFEGEIIGSKYTFLTQHQDWGSNDKVDLQHWAKFAAFRPFQKAARKGHFHIPNLAQRDNIFMRWKEHFLVPDHRVRTISGASFEGFYYICFNQIHGTVSGIYFHAKSEKFQQLELKHVEDRGCFAAMEFR